ncbi:MAG: hypothetical protein ACR2OK_03630 [Parvibaculales bacterium]|nr:hypothetical protein [Alphaproteobacteria bacterium]
MSGFWRNWIDIWCLAMIALGVVLAGAGLQGFEGGVRLILTLQNPENPAVFNDVERFAFGLTGALSIGWGLTFFYFFRAAHSSNMGDKMYRQSFVVLIVWNLVDGYISYATGFTLNIASNLILSFGLIIPLYMTGKLSD